MKKIIEKLGHFIISNFLIILLELLLLVLLILFRKGFLILGGEGNYFLNPSVLFSFNGAAWKSFESAGYPNPLINYSFVIFHFITGLWKIGLSYSVINLLLVYLAYSGPLLSMYWLARRIFKLDGFSGTLIALFYVLNPFSAFHIQEMMFWNIAPLVSLPIFFGIIYLNYEKNSKLFLYFGVACLLAAFSFANIPYLGIFQIFIVLSLFVIPLLQGRKLKLTEYILKLIVLESAFVLFSGWWLFNLVRIQIQDIGTLYTKDFAVSWAKYASGDGGVMQKLFSFKALISPTDGTFFARFYDGMAGNIIMILPFLALIFMFIFVKEKKTIKTLSVFALILLIIMFLNKGVNQPLSFLYIWMLDKIPFFIIFKSPLEKFSVLFLFFFTITMLFLMISNKNRKILNYVFVAYILFAAIPFIALKFMPDFSIGIDKFVSRKFVFKEEYQQIIDKMNNDKLYYKYLSLPGSLNYQVTMLNHDNKYYRGMDPLLYAINKPFIAAYSGDSFKVLYDNLSDKNIENIMGAFSIRKIMINSDIVPSFGFLEKESPAELKNLFSKTMATEQFGNVGLYSLKSYVPVIYTPTREININNPSNDPTKVFEKMVSGDFKYGTEIVSEADGSSTADNIVDFAENSRPTIEYKKLSEVKYRVFVHGLKQEMPLVFNESFNKGWKLFQPTAQITNGSIANISGSASDEDAASSDDITNDINEKVISKTTDDLGNHDFISKSFNKTIQNDNLSNGTFNETWPYSVVGENTHNKVNGYANGWVLNPKELCASNKCIKNADGSYDLELVVEFAPQKFYYLGWAVTACTFVFAIPVAIFVRRKNKADKKLDDKERDNYDN